MLRCTFVNVCFIKKKKKEEKKRKIQYQTDSDWTFKQPGQITKMECRPLVWASVCLVSVFVLCESRTHYTTKKCLESVRYSALETYRTLVECPYYVRRCRTNWMGQRVCTTERRIGLCSKILTRTVFKNKDVPACCTGYTETADGRCAQDCHDDKYGFQCQKSCACPTNANPSCDVTDGSCTCYPGWQGSDCNIVCPSGTFGQDCKNTCSCADNESCDSADGNCVSVVALK